MTTKQEINKCHLASTKVAISRARPGGVGYFFANFKDLFYNKIITYRDQPADVFPAQIPVVFAKVKDEHLINLIDYRFVSFRGGCS